MSKEEIIAAIQACAEKLGRAPTRPEVQKMFPQASRRTVRSRFATYRNALNASGLEPTGGPWGYSRAELVKNWASVVRNLQHLPTMQEYEALGGYSLGPLVRRFKSWLNVPQGMEQYMATEGLEQEYADVLEMIKASRAEGAKAAAFTVAGGPHAVRPPIEKAGPVFGIPLATAPLVFAPTNEAGVLLLFGMLAERLGFIVTRVQAAFPDCHALLKLDDSTCQLLRIEFEYESRNFRDHGHVANECDMIVCWIHNWKECPLEVVELKAIVMELLKGRGNQERESVLVL